MANITNQDVICLNDKFSSIAPALVTDIVNDVILTVSDDFGNRKKMAQRYLAAHYLQLIVDAGGHSKAGALKSEKIADWSREYAQNNYKDSNRFDETIWGKTYFSIAKTLVTANVFPA
jgi:hypothetical protein